MLIFIGLVCVLMTICVASLPSPESPALDFSNFNKLWGQARKEARLTHIHFHDLRHTFASHLTMASGDLMAVQGLLRLKTPALVMRYSHLAPGHLRHVALSLDKQLALKPAQEYENASQPIRNPITTLQRALVESP